MQYLPNAAQAKAADQYTIQELHTPSLELMERAARALTEALYDWELDLGKVLIFCGSGNNGGDGFAAGRMLLQDGYDVCVCFCGRMESRTADCRLQMERYLDLGGALCKAEDAAIDRALADAGVVIDAIFGVGLSRPVTGHYADLIGRINASGAVRVAADLPSGLCADTGWPLGCAVSADYTVTFQFLKLGMACYPGKEICGRIRVADIGIDDIIFSESQKTACRPDISDYQRLLPVRREDSHKGSYGKVLAIAGSVGMCGAAYFNAKSAYLAGAGLVRIYTPEENRAVLQGLLPEAIITPYTGYDEQELTKLLDWADVVCIGSGIGQSETARSLVKKTLADFPGICVADADALNLLAAHPQDLPKDREKTLVVTPHILEMARLCGCTADDVRGDRVSALESWLSKCPSVCILKDARTMIAGSEKRTVLNVTGNSAMAKGGSGDVLTGIVTGLLAQGISGMDGAVLGTWLHGLAGDLARKKKGAYSVLAGDLMEEISAAFCLAAEHGARSKKADL